MMIEENEVGEKKEQARPMREKDKKSKQIIERKKR